uniref:Uncharacterized protein n=1 Tax=Arundo donax TaxID=35708 RepID=A0A0A9CZ56_ARUDO
MQRSSAGTPRRRRRSRSASSASSTPRPSLTRLAPTPPSSRPSAPRHPPASPPPHAPAPPTPTVQHLCSQKRMLVVFLRSMGTLVLKRSIVQSISKFFFRSPKKMLQIS